ncbi:MAG: hypothetical protein KGL91_06725 [Xanthomonadaceae bacterium]|nr:hypothetical protein [Xanthomonadaceae bacterium]
MRPHHALPVLLIPLLAGCQPAATPAGTSVAHLEAPATPQLPAPAPAAPAIARVDLGNRVGSDQRVPVPMLHFAPDDTIHAAVLHTGHSPTLQRIDARWSHLDSKQTFLTEGKNLPFNGDAATTFQISRPNGWPTGNYKVEILLNGKLVQTRLFDVVLPATATAAPR